MSDGLTVNERVTIPLAEIALTASRASGPGGQHVNTADTRVQLRWNPTTSAVLTPPERALVCRRLASRLTTTGDLVLACGLYRSQRRNRQACLERLARLLRAALVPEPTRRASRPTAAAREKRLREKKRRSEAKQRRRKPDEPE